MTPQQAEELLIKNGLNPRTKLRIVRVRRGLSQSELAAASGVPKATIQRYEQDPNTIDGAKLGTICDLSEALDCKITDIIEDKDLIERFNKVK
jgi:transcriptional regulator with XRE-family HTH domain